MLNTLAVVDKALRLLLRHWPVLFALMFAGYAVRRGVLWLSVRASDLHAALGYLVFALVPIVMLMTFVLMLRVVRPSLTTAAKSQVIGHMGSVLVPFMAVYMAFDLFRADHADYVWFLLQDEVFSNPDIFKADGDVNIERRLPFVFSPLMLWVVGVAVALRFGLGLWKKSAEIPWLGYLRAYLEVLWFGIVMGAVVKHFKAEWYENRRVVRWFTSTWEDLLSLMGPFKDATAWIGDALTSVDTTLVPLAWLAVGVVVYGREQTEEQPVTPRGPLRWALSDARENLAPLQRAIMLIRNTGLRPMLLFCLAFLFANSTPSWLWQLERAIIGPQDIFTIWMPLSSILGMLNETAGLVAIICLVAAAADRMLMLTAAQSDAAADGQAGELGELSGQGDPHGNGPGVSGSGEIHRGLVRV